MESCSVQLGIWKMDGLPRVCLMITHPIPYMRSCIHPGYVGPLSSPLERGHDGFQPMVRVEWVVRHKTVQTKSLSSWALGSTAVCSAMTTSRREMMMASQGN
jgi:hypothetical protein